MKWIIIANLIIEIMKLLKSKDKDQGITKVELSDIVHKHLANLDINTTEAEKIVDDIESLMA